MINFKQFLLEVNAEHNGTGGTQPPTVIYPTIDLSLDGSELMRSGKPQLTNNQNNETDVFWTRFVEQYSEDMRRMGATPEQITNMLRLLRQQFFLYHSGSQGSMDSMEMIHRMDRFYNKLLSRQSWYQSYWDSIHARATVNRGIDKVNNWTLNWPFNVPGIPNINSQPTYP
jgi:hypothetical protein